MTKIESAIETNARTMSIVIVTYFRGPYLLESIRHLEPQRGLLEHIHVVDQTPEYPPEVETQLETWHQQGVIDWHRLSKPSITNAMNYGLVQASSDLILFLDDDVIPSENLVDAHRLAYSSGSVCGAVGQVLQPGEEAISNTELVHKTGIYKDLDFKFNFSDSAFIENVIACNLSVDRRAALEAGGFDENFIGVAYRFETEFAKRLVRTSGTPLLFEPTASLKHLQAPSGGTRKYGNPLTSASPDHSVGDYYYAMRCAAGFERYVYIVGRALRAVRTRFHLTHPWWIPVKLLGELRGLLQARKLFLQGPRILTTPPAGRQRKEQS